MNEDIKIPQTDSIQELARFWDSHDLTDFENELEEVQESILEPIVPLTLTSEEAAAVTAAAKSRGISPVMLIREWGTEGIKASAKLEL
ncbi:MAG: CopG family antitoxin [Candidatus Poribacteria bacterium]|nr:CopG family antitoxin [Candidatus Poribacteria bacterium]